MKKTMLKFRPWMEVVRLRLLERSDDSCKRAFVPTQPQMGDKIYVARDNPLSIRIWRGNERKPLFWGGTCRVQDRSDFFKRNRIDSEPLELGGSSGKILKFSGLSYLGFERPKDQFFSDVDLAVHALAGIFPHLVFTLEKCSKDEDPIMPNGVVYIKEVRSKPIPAQ